MDRVVIISTTFSCTFHTFFGHTLLLLQVEHVYYMLLAMQAVALNGVVHGTWSFGGVITPYLPTSYWELD